MAGISSRAAATLDNKYKFGGKELNSNEFGDGSGLELYDFSARNFDPQLGRFWSGDPKADKLVQWSPYTYALNSPILFFDPDGEYPWPVHVRSFISTKTTGGGSFRGDGRGPSTATDGSATSRVRTSFVVDPAKGSISKPTSVSDPTVFYGIGAPGTPAYIPPKVKTGTPSASINNQEFSDNSASFDFSHSGKDPLTPGLFTPELDVHASLSMTEDLKSGVLSVSGSFTGDVFPSTEAFVVDQSGKTKLFLNAVKEVGGIGDLYGDNNKPLFKVNMQIQIDKKGNFTGVKQGDKLYTVDEWNKHIQDSFK